MPRYYEMVSRSHLGASVEAPRLTAAAKPDVRLALDELETDEVYTRDQVFTVVALGLGRMPHTDKDARALAAAKKLVAGQKQWDADTAEIRAMDAKPEVLARMLALLGKRPA